MKKHHIKFTCDDTMKCMLDEIIEQENDVNSIAEACRFLINKNYSDYVKMEKKVLASMRASQKEVSIATQLIANLIDNLQIEVTDKERSIGMINAKKVVEDKIKSNQTKAKYWSKKRAYEYPKMSE